MKWRWLLLMGSLALSACAAWQVREPLGVTIADLRPLEMNLLEQRYAVTVRVLNPNNVDIAFDGVAFDLEFNGKPFAKGVSRRGGVVPRLGEALIDLQVVSGLQNILRQLAELQKADQPRLAYRIHGRLYVPGGLGFIPFDTTGEFSLPASGGRSRS